MAGSAEDTPEDRNLRTLARWRQTGRVLIEALPYILKYDQKTIVVKYGGNAMTGTGAHDFSETYEEHSRKVSVYLRGGR